MRVLGIDIGGTNIKYALFRGQRIIEQGEMPSEASSGARRLLSNIFTLCDRFEFDLLGVSTAGIVGTDGEIAYASGNIPNYTGTRLRSILEERYSVRVHVLNDISASAYAEVRDELARELSTPIIAEGGSKSRGSSKGCLSAVRTVRLSAAR